jgi:hypothetical protein
MTSEAISETEKAFLKKEDYALRRNFIIFSVDRH